LHIGASAAAERRAANPRQAEVPAGQRDAYPQTHSIDSQREDPMIRSSIGAAALASIALLSGCASIVSGQNQSLSVTAKNKGGDVSGAKCALNNDKGTWYVTTPGSVTVRRSFNDLSVNCALDGLDPGIAVVKSATKGMAFGNILFGGLIGAGVDTATGAAYDYPEIINVDLGVVGKVDAAAAKPKSDAPAIVPVSAEDTSKKDEKKPS
jgi:hypothetical protein